MPEEPTTPDLVELLRQATEAGNRLDFEGVLAIYAPDAVWDMSRVGLGEYKGVEAIYGWLADWVGAYEELETDIEEILDLGNGVTWGVLLQKGRPVGSSGFVELRYAAVSTFEDGLIQRTTNYTDIDEARAAAERLAEERG